jgi:hypothetical protein
VIRFEYYLRRQSSVSSEGFQVAWHESLKEPWLDVLTSLGCQRALAVLGQDNDLFVQMNRARGGSMQAPFDLVLELWWATEAEAVQALIGGGLEQLADLVAAQAAWLDAGQSPAWLAMEYPQVNPTPEDLVASAGSVLKKLQFPLQHRRDLSEAAARQYWLQSHGPLIRQHAPDSGIARYVQVHRLDHPVNANIAAALGFVCPVYLGHAEVWVGPGGGSQEARRLASRAAVEDEAKFIDFASSTLFTGIESRLIE